MGAATTSPESAIATFLGLAVAVVSAFRAGRQVALDLAVDGTSVEPRVSAISATLRLALRSLEIRYRSSRVSWQYFTAGAPFLPDQSPFQSASSPFYFEALDLSHLVWQFLAPNNSFKPMPLRGTA